MEPTSISQVSKLIFPFPATKTTNQVTFPQQFSSQRHLNKTLFLYKNINYETVPAIPSMNEILSSSKAQNVDIKLQTFGPLFRITAKSLLTENELGKAEGIIRVWLRGKILHMDSIRLKRETLGMEKSIFGIGLFIGAVAIRYGYDCGCKTAELLAINDSDLYHSKLVRFYKRIGFKVVHEVDGSSIGDMSHMLVWGGIGTRMDADIEELLIKWCSRDWGLGEQIIFPIHEYSILDVVYTVVQYKLSKNRRALTKGDVDLRFRNEAKISAIKIGNFNLTLST